MHDLHVHLDFMENGEDVAREAADAGTLLFANTVTPAGFRAARARFAGMANVRVGLGLHPWWVGGATGAGVGAGTAGAGAGTGAAADAAGAAGAAAGAGAAGAGVAAAVDAEAQADELIALLDETRFVGEVGLDFGPRHGSSPEARDAQVAAFTRIARECARRGGKVLSIHSVKAAREVLDILDATGALASCTCVFHWYTGPSDQLKRAVDLGCLFSVGARMTATRKGREYVKAIPVRQLLLETDAPPGEGVPFSYAELRAQLQVAADAIAAARGPEALAVVEATSRQVLDQDGA